MPYVCEYCGWSSKKELDSCPSCGAKLIWEAESEPDNTSRQSNSSPARSKTTKSAPAPKKTSSSTSRPRSDQSSRPSQPSLSQRIERRTASESSGSPKRSLMDLTAAELDELFETSSSSSPNGSAGPIRSSSSGSSRPQRNSTSGMSSNKERSAQSAEAFWNRTRTNSFGDADAATPNALKGTSSSSDQSSTRTASSARRTPREDPYKGARAAFEKEYGKGNDTGSGRSSQAASQTGTVQKPQSRPASQPRTQSSQPAQPAGSPRGFFDNASSSASVAPRQTTIQNPAPVGNAAGSAGTARQTAQASSRQETPTGGYFDKSREQARTTQRTTVPMPAPALAPAIQREENDPYRAQIEQLNEEVRQRERALARANRRASIHSFFSGLADVRWGTVFRVVFYIVIALCLYALWNQRGIIINGLFNFFMSWIFPFLLLWGIIRIFRH